MAPTCTVYLFYSDSGTEEDTFYEGQSVGFAIRNVDLDGEDIFSWAIDPAGDGSLGTGTRNVTPYDDDMTISSIPAGTYTGRVLFYTEPLQAGTEFEAASIGYEMLATVDPFGTISMSDSTVNMEDEVYVNLDTYNNGGHAIDSYRVLYGDGNEEDQSFAPAGTGDFATHFSYALPGIYTVEVHVSDDSFATTDYLVNIAVVTVAAPTPPTATVVPSQMGGRQGTEIVYSLTTTTGASEITGWSFDFGGSEGTDDGLGVPDGATPVQPTHTYADAGTYTPVLTLTTADTLTYDFSPGNIVIYLQNPSVSVVVHPTSGSNPLDVDFEVTVVNPDYTIATYTIDYDDGEDTGSGDPDGMTFTTTYGVGRHHPVLTLVMDDDSEWAFLLATVIVDQRRFDGTASLAASVAVGVTPLTVNFTVSADRGSDSATGDVFVLHPGDGSSISIAGDPSGVVVSHEYLVPGRYKARLVMEGEDYSGTVAR